MDDIYSSQILPNIRARRSTGSFVVPFYKEEIARKSISYLESKIWNDLNQDIKASPSAKSFKHASKRRFFKSIKYLKSGETLMEIRPFRPFQVIPAIKS